MAAINDFILGKGWTCIGKCGCSVDMWKYVSSDHKGYEVRISVNGSGKFSIRHQDITRYSGIGESQLINFYNQLFNG